MMGRRIALGICLGFVWYSYNFIPSEGTRTITKREITSAAVETTPLWIECNPFHESVEIGTSNFDTFIQKKKLRDTGLSADAMQN